jgi:hypothetical protein
MTNAAIVEEASRAKANPTMIIAKPRNPAANQSHPNPQPFQVAA